MNFQHRQIEPSYEAACRARAAAVRARLLRPANAVKEVVVQPPAAAAIVAQTQHDAHVKAWQVWLIEQAMRCTTYIKRRCDELGVSYADIIGRSRVRTITAARQLLMYEIKTQVKPEISFNELGNLFGGRDHSTAIHAVIKHGYEIGDGNKCSPEQVERMKELRSAGLTVAEVAERVGCCVDTVHRHTNVVSQANYEARRDRRRATAAKHRARRREKAMA